MCQLSRETLLALYQCEQRAVALYYADNPTDSESRKKAVETLEEEFGADVVERMFRNGIGNNRGPKPAPAPTFIANTTDGIPVYWGKSSTGDMSSPDLQFWVAVGYPSHDNQIRVPYFLECVCSNMGYKQVQWNELISVIVANLSSDALLEWNGSQPVS